VQNLASFSTSLKFEAPAFENAARYLNAETNFKYGEVVSTHPWELLGRNAPPPKVAFQKRVKSSTTRPWIIRFRSNFVQTLNAWHPKCCKSSRSSSQRSRWQRDNMCKNLQNCQ